MSDAPIGSAAEEARRLSEALRRARRESPSPAPSPSHSDSDSDSDADSAKSAGAGHASSTDPVLRLVADAGAVTEGLAPSVARLLAGEDSRGEDRPPHPSDTCDSCPWCRGRRWAHDHAPQVLRDIADVGDLLARGLRSAATTIEARAGRGTATTDPAEESPRESGRSDDAGTSNLHDGRQEQA